MGLFNKQAAAPQTPEMKYHTARSNLLLVVAFTAINLVLQVIGADLYFLFSAFVPLYMAALGAMLGEVAGVTALYIVGIVAAVAGIGVYLLCYFLSKKHHGWMIAALVLFSLDCVFLLLNFSADFIIDLLMHAWVMYYLILGVKNGGKRGQQPEMPAEGYPVEPQPPVMMVNGEPVAEETAPIDGE